MNGGVDAEIFPRRRAWDRCVGIDWGKRIISPDGKVMTITTKGTNAAGQTINNVQVFEKR